MGKGKEKGRPQPTNFLPLFFLSLPCLWYVIARARKMVTLQLLSTSGSYNVKIKYERKDWAETLRSCLS
jgi:hypothetical protein